MVDFGQSHFCLCASAQFGSHGTSLVVLEELGRTALGGAHGGVTRPARSPPFALAFGLSHGLFDDSAGAVPGCANDFDVGLSTARTFQLDQHLTNLYLVHHVYEPPVTSIASNLGLRHCPHIVLIEPVSVRDGCHRHTVPTSYSVVVGIN